MSYLKNSSKRLSASLWFGLACFCVWWIIFGGPTRRPSIYNHEAPNDAEWMMTADSSQYTGCFRKTIDFTGKVKRGWIAVSSYGGYELLCNGSPVGAQTYWRPTRMFQNGLTESGQRVNAKDPIVAYNFPREYQWSGHRNDQMVTFFDLSDVLEKGRNVIALEIESRIAQPSVIAFGEVVLETGEIVAIRSDTSWKAEPVPLNQKQMLWSHPKVSVKKWQQAIIKKEGGKRFLSTVPLGCYSADYPTSWQILNGSASNSVQEGKFTTSIDNGVELSVLTHGAYWIWINDHLLNPVSRKKGGYNGDEWAVGWTGRRPLATPPELLDADEASAFFGGERFLDPRHGDPTDNDFSLYENTQNRTSERPNQTGDVLQDGTSEERGREQDPYGFLEEPEIGRPRTILRKRNPAQFHSYDISRYIVIGENRVSMRLVKPDDLGYGASQASRYAISCSKAGIDLEIDWDKKDDQVRHTDPIDSNTIPAKKFVGGMMIPTSILEGLAVIFVGIVLSYCCRLSLLKKTSVIFSLITLLFFLLEYGFQERSEILWFLSTSKWLHLAILTAITLVALLIDLLPRRMRPRSKLTWSGWICVILLLLLFLLRAWKVDLQPIDDDEYASIQAILSIVETGKPEIADDIWYSRSPFYHYAAAAFAKVFGAHIWSLRLYSVFLAVLTGWLLWLIGKRYLGNRYISSMALVFFTLHPFLIFSGHIARFYQQQQFFVVLMLHLFIQGFINGKSRWYRAGSVLVFALATLSQEISISFVPVFFILYLLFGKGVKWSWDIKTILYIIFAGVLIFADVALFKVKCLTRATGISPNVEATLAPTFWELGNLFSMFIGYARLHLVLSFFYLVSLIFSLRRGGEKLISLHLAFIISIVAFNFIITSVSFRYMYSIIPLWILLSSHGIYLFSHWVSSHVGENYTRKVSFICCVTVITSFSPWRIIDSYNEKILGDSISALGYVRQQIREDDKVMITEPHPHAAKIEIGRVDYDLVVPILYDFSYNKNGVLRDRNGDAEVVNRLAQLQQIFAENERVWIIVNREKFRNRKKNIRWEYPGAREELFLRENCQVAYRAYLWTVYLWDSNRGKLKVFRGEPNSWIE